MDALSQETRSIFAHSSTRFACSACKSCCSQAEEMTAKIGEKGCAFTPPSLFHGLHLTYDGNRRLTQATIKDFRMVIKLEEDWTIPKVLHLGHLHLHVLNMNFICNPPEPTTAFNVDIMHLPSVRNVPPESVVGKLAFLFETADHLFRTDREPHETDNYPHCWKLSDFEDTNAILIEEFNVVDGYKAELQRWLLPRLFFLDAAEGVSLILVLLNEGPEVDLFRAVGAMISLHNMAIELLGWISPCREFELLLLCKGSHSFLQIRHRSQRHTV
ncbi:hypothetical protein C8R43DRAFT_1017290 [Mycena crocata]|nr:hypothetical protein C8R43DRAFT_1017290 [Mycena crocata]